MNELGIEICSDLDDVYTNLFVQKIKEFMEELFGESSNYSKYVSKVQFSRLTDGEITDFSIFPHLMDKGIYTKDIKNIFINVDNNIPIIYQNLYHELQHAKNNSVAQKYLKNSSKYPIVYKFIDEYSAYYSAINHMISTEFKGNNRLLAWYMEYLKKSIHEFKERLYSDISLLSEKIKANENLENKEVSNLVYKIAYTIAVINNLRLNDFDIRLSPLILDMDKIELPITNTTCKFITSSLEIVRNNYVSLIKF